MKESLGGLLVIIAVFVMPFVALISRNLLIIIVALALLIIGNVMHGKGSGPMRGGF